MMGLRSLENFRPAAPSEVRFAPIQVTRLAAPSNQEQSLDGRGCAPGPHCRGATFVARYKCSSEVGGPMLKKLPPREREIVDLLYERGDLTVAEISEALPGQPSGSAVRTMLSRLEHKGFVRRTD